MSGNTEQDRQQHPATQITTIQTDPDEVIEALAFNEQSAEHKNQRTAYLRVSPPFSSEVSASIHFAEEGAYYPPEMSPKPVHIDPWAFVDESEELPERPTRAQSRQIAEKDHRNDVDEETVEKYHDAAIEVWEDETRNALKETVEIEIQAESNVTATVKYENTDSQ